MGSLKKRKMMKNQMKNDENSRIFQMFQFCGILGVFQGNLRQLGDVVGLSRGVLEASWGVLEPSWSVLEASWRCLGGVLGHLGGILDVSWEKRRKNVESNWDLGSQNGGKIVKIHVLNATCFS